MKTVTLQQAWIWRCPDCDHTNTHVGCKIKDPNLIADLEADKEALEDAFGPLDMGELTSEFLITPETVHCIKCESFFDVAWDDE